MSEIPKDVWKIATKVWSEAECKIITIDSQAVIAKAIWAERRRCAELVGIISVPASQAILNQTEE